MDLRLGGGGPENQFCFQSYLYSAFIIPTQRQALLIFINRIKDENISV